MHIVHIIARFNRGGTASWLKLLIKEQLKAGHKVTLMAGHVQKGELEDSAFTELGGIRIENLGRNVNFLDDLRAFIEIKSQLKTLTPDLINTHTSKAGLLGRLAGLSISKSAVVHTFHGHVLYGYFSSFIVTFIIFLEKQLSKITDLILVSGEQVKIDLVNAGIAEASKFYVVRPGVELNNLKFKPKKTGNCTVGWLGRLAQVKRPDRVIAIAKELPEINFIIGGEGDLRNLLEENAPKNVKFLGWTSPIDFWSQCDIALLTSENEAQPISLVEAALSNLPAVAEDVGSVKEVVENGTTGFLTHSKQERIEAVRRLAKEPELRTSMGENAKTLAEIKFGVTQFIEGHEKAYKLAFRTHNLRLKRFN